MKLYIKFVVTLIVMSIAGVFQGCGSMEKILPDRKKEYQFSSEIPPLEIPPDLTASTIEKTSIKSASKSTKTSAASYSGQVSNEIERPKVEPEPEDNAVVETGDDGSFIEIEKPYPIAWRMIGRALSQLEIEIDDLNRSEGLYYIIFRDRQGQQEDDNGFLSFLAFWSDGSGAGAEEEYQVKLTDAKGVTEVRVLNEDGQPESQGTGLNVLKMLQKQVNQQIAEKQN